ncbi:MAG: hypothetical protein WC307_06005 [Candidatus Nanoarchaeia archaeon]
MSNYNIDSMCNDFWWLIDTTLTEEDALGFIKFLLKQGNQLPTEELARLDQVTIKELNELNE